MDKRLWIGMVVFLMLAQGLGYAEESESEPGKSAVYPAIQSKETVKQPLIVLPPLAVKPQVQVKPNDAPQDNKH